MNDKEITLLVVDDELDMRIILGKVFSDAGYSVCLAQNGPEALTKVKEIQPDLIVLDVRMPGMDGMEVKHALNQNEKTADIPVVFLSAEVSTPAKVKGLRLRADDYVTKPFDTEEILARVDAALSRRKRYETLSMMDALTGCPNANYFKKELALAFHLARKYRRIFSLVVLDIDNFKKINDTFGHEAGDEVLKTIAERMRHALRKPDVLTRYGGDEFTIILQEDTAAQAVHALTRLKNEIEGSPLSLKNGTERLSVTLSMGTATYRDGLSNETELFDLADKAMYRDKQRKKREPG